MFMKKKEIKKNSKEKHKRNRKKEIKLCYKKKKTRSFQKTIKKNNSKVAFAIEKLRFRQKIVLKRN